MKTLAGVICLLLFSHPALCQEAVSDSMELHVDGKIFITLTKEQINTHDISIPLQKGVHKISWVMKHPELVSAVLATEIMVMKETIANVIVRNSKRVKNYSEL